MNASFLYHAIAAGLDMGIVNPTQLEVYDEIDKKLLVFIEDVLLNRRRMQPNAWSTMPKQSRKKPAARSGRKSGAMVRSRNDCSTRC